MIIGLVLLGFWASIAFIAFTVIGLLGFSTFFVYVIPISKFRIYVVVYFGFMMIAVFAVWTL